MAGKMQEGISVADLDADSLNESAENTQEDQIQDQIQNDQLEDAQLDDSLSPEHYDASDLRVLEGLEAVRIRPGMYIGSTGPRGLHHLVYEIVDNSVDEALAGYASHIEVTILPDGGVRVVDDGRGIPVDEVPGEGISGVETVMTKLHAGGKFGGGGYAVSGGLHGVGASVVNALSTWLEVEVVSDGILYFQRFERGKAVTELQNRGPAPEGRSRGTVVRFQADPEIFKETTVYEYDTLQKRLREQAFLNAGVNIQLTDERPREDRPENEQDREVPYQNDYCYEGGVSSFVEFINANKEVIHPDVIHFSAVAQDLSLIHI